MEGPKGNWWAQLNPFKEKPTVTVVNNQPEPDKNKNNEDPNNNKNKKTSEQGDDPLLNFETLWQPEVDKDGKPVVKDNTPKPYLPPMDQKKFGEFVNKMNFMGDVTEEHLAAIKEGGDKATNAFMQMINNAGRKAFTSAFTASQKMAEQGLAQAVERMKSEMPNHFRDLATDTALFSGEDSWMNNPALKPVVDSVKKQYLEKFPKASPADIQKGVKEYFAYLKNVSTAKPEQKNDPNAALRQGTEDADFLKWIETEVGATPQNTFDSSATPQT